MEKKTDKKKVASKGRRKNSKKKLIENLRSDYFARFRFDLEGLLEYLKSVSGQPFVEAPLAYQCLDDLGYWTLVRQSDIFEFSPELESSLKAQFEVLAKKFDYHAGDVVVWSDMNSLASPQYFLGRVLEQVVEDEQDLFRIELINTGATLLVSRYELDYWNAPGSSLPIDHLGEGINWDKDNFWRKILSNFKEMMALRKFQFDFTLDEVSLKHQQEALLEEIYKFCSLSQGDLIQSGRGLGFLACGQGTAETSALVMAFALQALGQSFGINARLWGVQNDNIPAFLFCITARSEDQLRANLVRLSELSDKKPIQRPLSEVVTKVLAKGPFGKGESRVLIRGSMTPVEGKGDETVLGSNKNS